MARNATNGLLHKAKASKSDEFYTLMKDIESELQHYVHHFKGKVIYCNCDDSLTSNFYKYFHAHFKQLGLKGLMATCYRPTSCDLFSDQPTETGSLTEYFSVSEGPRTIPLKGNGDFRSEECIELLKKADIVVTNPPFSLFREFVAQLARYEKGFLIIGNINAITYKEIFNLIQADKAWLGLNLGRGISGFKVPANYPLYGTEARIDENGNRIISPNNCLWLTNLSNSQRCSLINLQKIFHGNERIYPKYDNCDAINVNRTQDIPYDYRGLMGVPITFLHKYNPGQFEIVRFRKGDDGKDLSINGKCPYFRILIRNRHPRRPDSYQSTLIV